MQLEIEKSKNLLFCALTFCLLTGEASIVEWAFPRTASCHEGLAFADGVTGVLVWGGHDTVNLTVGRSDLWDQRGGSPWPAARNYTNICALVRAGAFDRIKELFKPTVRPGEPKFPYMLPLGRVVLKLADAEILRGTLDTHTGIGTLDVVHAGVTGRVEIAMSKRDRVFAMRFPEGLSIDVKTIPAMSTPVVKDELTPIGFGPARERVDGFDWDLPADPSVSLTWRKGGQAFFLATARSGRATIPDVMFDSVRSASQEYWRDFWAEGAQVSVPDATVQRIYDYGMYRFGAMTDPDGVPAGLQGPWLEDDRMVPWNGDFHFNINVQECYSPAFRGGHLRNLMPLFRMILSWRPVLRENARKLVGIDDGYVLPHSVSPRCVTIGSFWSGTLDHASTAWVAKMMYDYVTYSGDKTFLREQVYDFMRGAMNVYVKMLERAPDGSYALPLGPSPEWGDMKRPHVGRNPSFQLAAIHRLARDLMAASAMLGVAADPLWVEIDRRLPPYTAEKDKGILIFENEELQESHRHHSHMAGFYPFDTIDFSAGPAREVAEMTYHTWIFRGMGAWAGWAMPWASVLHTHAGNADSAVQMLHLWDTYFCNPGHGSRHDVYRPGLSIMRRGQRWSSLGVCGDEVGEDIMQMDGQCASATAVLELMVHEVNGKAAYFRGCPEAWQKVSFKNVRLSDGTRVSASRDHGKISL